MDFNGTSKGKTIRVCRVCLGDVKKKGKSLFQNFMNMPLYCHLLSIATVDIRENDGFPDKVCSQCLTDLEVALSFKKKCEESDTILRANNTAAIDPPEVIYKEEVKEEPEDATDDTDNVWINDDNFDECQTFDVTHGYDQTVVKCEDKKEGNLKLCDSTQTKELLHYETNTKNYANDNNQALLKELTPKPQFKSKAIDLRLQCDDCKDFFKSKCKLSVHWKKVHMRQNIICHSCKRHFKTYKAFHKHQKNKPKSCIEASHFHIEGLGKSRMIFCKECSYKSNRMKDMISHRVTHTGERPYICNECGKGYTQVNTLISHKESAHGEYRVEITCHYCGKLVKGRRRVYRHLKYHSSPSVKCKVCDKVFKNQKILHTHMLRHNSVKKAQCDYCESQFYTSAEKRTHTKIVHLRQGRQMHACDLCTYKSSQKKTILMHRMKHASDNFPCTHCGMFFTSADKLSVHKQRHNERNYVCPQCDKKFGKKYNLKNHIRNQHLKTEQFECEKVKTQVE